MLKISFDARRRAANWILAVLFLAGAPLLAHFLYSWMGFNPTDDGFTLAYSRRILDGQIPHLDFITIRPFLSPVLHMPEAAWAGDHMLMASRLVVWVQFACIAWIWARMINRMHGRPLGSPACFAAAVICLAFSANTWPIMAWHTVDGLFLASLGLAICTGERERLKAAGYALIASAYLCKQSFLFAAPLALVILGDWRKTRNWLAILAPGAVYLVYLRLTGALDDAMIQFNAHTVLKPILDRYWASMTSWFLLGYLALRLIHRRPEIGLLQSHPKIQAWIGAGLIFTLPVYDKLSLLFNGRPAAMSHTVFWVVAGSALYYAVDGRNSGHGRLAGRVSFLALLLAFCVSVSVGAANPSLMGGPLFLILLVNSLEVVGMPAIRTALVLVLAGFVAFGFNRSRHRHVYMEQPAARLTCKLDGVFHGARGVRTNPNTFAFLEDLQKAVALARQDPWPHAIVPDIPGYWASSVPRNPLPIDWAKNTELNTVALLSRVQDSLDSQRGRLTVIVQKVEAFPLRYGFAPLRDPEKFAVAHYVRTHAVKRGETKYFELYR